MHTSGDAAAAGTPARLGRHNGINGTNTVAATMHRRTHTQYHARVNTLGGAHGEAATHRAWPGTRGWKASGEMARTRDAHEADTHIHTLEGRWMRGSGSENTRRGARTADQAAADRMRARIEYCTWHGDGERGRESRVAASQDGETARTPRDSRRTPRDRESARRGRVGESHAAEYSEHAG